MVIDGLCGDGVPHMLRPGEATVKALGDDGNGNGVGDSVNGPLPCMLMHKRIFVLERHKEDTLTIKGWSIAFMRWACLSHCCIQPLQLQLWLHLR
jgi:hypothetical protein